MLRGIGAPIMLPGLVFASLTSVISAARLPSPAGTFGTMESGIAAGLVLDGVPPALG